jgi:hypothetical protein
VHHWLEGCGGGDLWGEEEAAILGEKKRQRQQIPEAAAAVYLLHLCFD